MNIFQKIIATFRQNQKYQIAVFRKFLILSFIPTSLLVFFGLLAIFFDGCDAQYPLDKKYCTQTVSNYFIYPFFILLVIYAFIIFRFKIFRITSFWLKYFSFIFFLMISITIGYRIFGWDYTKEHSLSLFPFLLFNTYIASIFLIPIIFFFRFFKRLKSK